MSPKRCHRTWKVIDGSLHLVERMPPGGSSVNAQKRWQFFPIININSKTILRGLRALPAQEARFRVTLFEGERCPSLLMIPRFAKPTPSTPIRFVAQSYSAPVRPAARGLFLVISDCTGVCFAIDAPIGIIKIKSLCHPMDRAYFWVPRKKREFLYLEFLNFHYLPKSKHFIAVEMMLRGLYIQELQVIGVITVNCRRAPPPASPRWTLELVRLQTPCRWHISGSSTC